MAFRIGSQSANSVRQKTGAALATSIDAQATAGTISIYTGAQPSDPSQAATGTLLVTISFAKPALTTADQFGSSGLAGGAAISQTVAATGTAGWFRVADGSGNALMDGSCGSSGADLNFDNISFVAGATCRIVTFALSQPM